MKEIYFLFLMVMVSIGSSYITTQMPALKRAYKRVLLRFKRKSRKVATNDLDALIQRIEKLETKVNKREANQRTFIRNEVKEYLINLQK